MFFWYRYEALSARRSDVRWSRPLRYCHQMTGDAQYWPRSRSGMKKMVGCNTISVVPEVIAIACCSRCGYDVDGPGSATVRYLMLVWTRNIIPPPLSLARSSLMVAWQDTCKLMFGFSLVSWRAAILMSLSSTKWTISWILLRMPLQFSWRILIGGVAGCYGAVEWRMGITLGGGVVKLWQQVAVKVVVLWLRYVSPEHWRRWHHSGHAMHWTEAEPLFICLLKTEQK